MQSIGAASADLSTVSKKAMTQTPSETARMAYAVKLAEAQIAEAKKLHEIHFGVGASPLVLAAIIEALARNHASALAAKIRS